MASARSAAHTASASRSSFFVERVAQPREDGLRRLRPDVAREHDLFDLLEDGRVDLLLALKERRQPRDEPAARRREALSRPATSRFAGGTLARRGRRAGRAPTGRGSRPAIGRLATAASPARAAGAGRLAIRVVARRPLLGRAPRLSAGGRLQRSGVGPCWSWLVRRARRARARRPRRRRARRRWRRWSWAGFRPRRRRGDYKDRATSAVNEVREDHAWRGDRSQAGGRFGPLGWLQSLDLGLQRSHRSARRRTRPAPRRPPSARSAARPRRRGGPGPASARARRRRAVRAAAPRRRGGRAAARRRSTSATSSSPAGGRGRRTAACRGPSATSTSPGWTSTAASTNAPASSVRACGHHLHAFEAAAAPPRRAPPATGIHRARRAAARPTLARRDARGSACTPASGTAGAASVRAAPRRGPAVADARGRARRSRRGAATPSGTFFHGLGGCSGRVTERSPPGWSHGASGT